MISISLSPNTQKDDILLALKVLFQPWRWKRGIDIEKFEGKLSQVLGIKNVVSFNSGRSSLLAIFDALNFERGSEILLQAFTCNAVPNPVIWSGLKPVFVDCSADYNIDITDLERKITPLSCAVIIQHTFGIPADIKEVQLLCKKYNLLLIEDCAHALGAMYNGKLVGTFGDISFFSFSRDKVISSVYGGAVATNNDEISEKLRQFQNAVSYTDYFWILQQLLHPIILNLIILPTYGLFGKYLLMLLQQLHILSKAVHWKEKRGLKPSYFPRRLPNALAMLAMHQLAKLKTFNAHRKELTKVYAQELKDYFGFPVISDEKDPVFLRLPLQHPRARGIIESAWRENLLLGDWYTTPIAPADTKLEAVGYSKGVCPKAESLAKTTLNLPTHTRIGKKESAQIIAFLKKYGSQND